jgi:hypothetical protein
MIIGKISSSSSHIEYLCQVHGPGETEQPPRPEDYEFGALVGIARRAGGRLVGVISNTTLLNPDFGNLGPRLSPEPDLAVFSPDYLAEKRTLVSITVLGVVGADGQVIQGVPAISAEIDAAVRRLTDDEIVAFHRTPQGVRAAYLPVLLSAENNPLMPPLTLRLIEQLERLFPQEAPRLALLKDNLAWRSRVQPLG